MEILLAYAAGLLTLINPCVLPVLPIVLASAANAHRLGPVALAAGMGLSFVALGMLVSTVGYAIGLTEDVVARAGAILMVGFGLILLVPQLSDRFASATSGLSARADSTLGTGPRNGLGAQFAGGLLLGAVWSPCIGPTLGLAISLAAQGENLMQVFFTMTFFAFGVASLILAIAYGLRAAKLRALASVSRPLMGAMFLLVGVLILTGFTHVIEGWLLSIMPGWLIDLSVSI